jgi:hypothetical protein
MYTIMACAGENMDRGYGKRNIYIQSNSQTTIKALDNYQINYKVV